MTPEYTKLTKEFLNEYATKFDIHKTGFKQSYCKEDPSMFSWYMMGIMPFDYQDYISTKIVEGKKRVIACTSRQIGKSIEVAILALWATIFNLYPSGVVKKTQVNIVSRSEDQSRKLLMEIKKLIRAGDIHMSKLLNGKPEHTNQFFTRLLDPKSPNSASQITWQNGSLIKCFPPTDAIRGETSSILIIDEAAFLHNKDPDQVYNESMLPTLSSTDGYQIIISTPREPMGFYYDNFDPENIKEDNKFERIWFDYHIRADQDPKYKAYVELEEEKYKLKGDMNAFRREYGAEFVQTERTFLDKYKVDECIDPELFQLDEYKLPCVVGIDYGMSNSNTTACISAMLADGSIQVIKMYNLGLNYDYNNMLPFIEEIHKRYNIVKIYADASPAGHEVSQKLESSKYNFETFDFRARKTEGYCNLRSLIYARPFKIRFPKDMSDCLTELKSMISTEDIYGKLHVQKLKGNRDDQADALLMSCAKWLEGEKMITSILVGKGSLDKMSPEALMGHNPKEANIREDSEFTKYYLGRGTK